MVDEPEAGGLSGTGEEQSNVEFLLVHEHFPDMHEDARAHSTLLVDLFPKEPIIFVEIIISRA